MKTKKKAIRALGGSARSGKPRATASKAISIRKRVTEAQRAADCVPTSWLDSLLTGPDAVIGKPPYSCLDIERVLNGVRLRILSLM